MDASSDMNRVGQQEKPAVYTFPTIKPADLPKVAEETIQYGQKKEQPEAMSPAVQEDNNNGVSRTEIEQLVKDFKRSCGDYHVSLKECNPEDTVVGPSVKRFPNASFDHYGIADGKLSTRNTGTQFFFVILTPCQNWNIIQTLTRCQNKMMRFDYEKNNAGADC